jgi:3-oxoadipate enol-lactonase
LNSYVIPAPDNPAARQRFRQLFIENFHGFLSPWYLARPLNPPTLQRLPEIHIPVLLLTGQLENPENLAVLETLATKVPNAQKILISGAGHLPQMEKPTEFNRAVLDFLTEQK